MRRANKVKAVAVIPLRRAAMSAAPASRRPFPAWIVSDEGPAAFSTRGAVTARVRDALVLRKVSKRENPVAPRSSHGSRAR